MTAPTIRDRIATTINTMAGDGYMEASAIAKALNTTPEAIQEHLDCLCFWTSLDYSRGHGYRLTGLGLELVRRLRAGLA